ncbi:MAG: Stp1/IreP family PP2C-type Ser/Thr phosphatase [Bacilli bacterium]|nr:Stp1/IreP family PP2C-type Ser/Thr phosphatase [Bacilli bacterium]MDD4607810.1 Stp1/IreP family PP2C-type Ser/Thr phosphatase [Bacilli bacterium]
MMECSYITDPGKVRSHNEDSVTIVVNNSDEYLLAVADGMGGHRGGEIASDIAISHIGDSFLSLDTIGSKEEAIEWLKEIVSEANLKIYQYTNENTESTGMGTTIVLAVLTKEYLLFGNIGDSSGFVIKDNHLHKITTDHTLVELLVKSGKLTPEEAKNHPRKNVLMRALGANTKVEMDIFDVETDINGILLCSDGLTNMLTDEQIMKVLNEKLPIDDKVKKLLYKSNNRGGTDNISIAYLSRSDKNDN